MRTKAIFAILFTLLVIGCGGGGGSSSDTGGQSYQFTPGQTLQAPIQNGAVTLPGTTFSQSGSVHVAESAAPAIDHNRFAAAQQLLTLSLPDLPNDTITVSYPDSRPDLPTLNVMIMRGGRPVATFPATRANGQVTVQLLPEIVRGLQGNAPQGRASSLTISLLLTFLTAINWPDQSTSLERVGTTNTDPSFGVFVHGLLQQGSDMTPAAVRAQSLLHYGSVYVAHFNWLRPFPEVAHELSALLRNMNLSSKAGDLWCYSKGGDIGHVVLEQDGVTLPFKRAIFLATPNKGCRFDLVGLYLLLGGMFYSPTVGVPFLTGPSDQCLTELMPGSQALSELNTPSTGQRGDVDYYFAAGTSDQVVSPDSALYQDDFTPEAQTIGAVYRLPTLPNHGHSDMSKPDVISTVCTYLRDRQASIGLWSTIDGVEGNRAEASPSDGSWYYEIHLKNEAGEPITIRSLEFEYYDLNRNHTSIDQWYDPNALNGIQYPTSPAYWGVSLQPNEEGPVLHVQTWPGTPGVAVWDYPQNYWGTNVHLTVLADGASGRLYTNCFDVRCGYNGVWPAWPPNTRAVHGPPTGAQPLSVSRR